MTFGDRKTPMKRTAFKVKPNAKKPAHRKSKKVSAFEAELNRMRPIIHRRSGGRCEIRIPGTCEGRATNIHHRLPRGNPRCTNELGNLVDLCGSGTTGCHGRIEHNRDEAYDNGWLLRDTWDLSFSGHIVTFDDDGQKQWWWPSRFRP